MVHIYGRVTEGNHRLVAAMELGWDYIAVDIQAGGKASAEVATWKEFPQLLANVDLQPSPVQMPKRLTARLLGLHQK